MGKSCRISSFCNEELAEKDRPYDAETASDFPAVGDYVMAKLNGADTALIHAVLPRKSVFIRKAAGSAKTEQVVAAGGVTLEAVALPGHTPGSMGLLLREERILLAGDAISPEMCLFFPESMGVEVYLDTLQRIMAMNLEGFVQGHFTRLFPARVLPKLEKCAHLPEQGKGLAYTNSLVRMGKGRVHVLSVRDPDVGGIICMITKEPGYDPEGLNALA